MKHLKKFNENADETLEPQDLLDFTQDIVDDGYEVTFITNSGINWPNYSVENVLMNMTLY